MLLYGKPLSAPDALGFRKGSGQMQTLKADRIDTLPNNGSPLRLGQELSTTGQVFQL
ncbi:Hypothetical protein DHA2_152725 [Giardia duodenalis]|uniref:Uncharacterized protein n=1 Tax=Giardia intestinalis TaxID=5741 RepID=V6TAN9_GIAIN|nr:Hypothetical protein DHA2_152725 [Giardia intestinalis]